MRALYLSPYLVKNLGDLIALKGTEYLIEKALGKHEKFYCDTDVAEEDISYLNTFKKLNPELLVVAGTPWIWHECTRSQKYRVLLRLLEYFPSAKKLAIGIGSCFPLQRPPIAVNRKNVENKLKSAVNQTASKLLNYLPQAKRIGVKFSSKLSLDANLRLFIANEENTILKNIWSKFQAIAVRDTVCKLIFDKLKINVQDSLCPSAFIRKFSKLENVPRTKRPLLVFYDPASGIGSNSLTNKFVKKYHKFELRFVKNYNPEVISITRYEKNYVEKEGYPCKYVKNINTLLLELKSAKFVLSGRVHAAIPAQALGTKSFLLAIDTRAYAATKLQIPLIFVPKVRSDNFLDLRRPKVGKLVDLYEKYLVECIEKNV